MFTGFVKGQNGAAIPARRSGPEGIHRKADKTRQVLNLRLTRCLQRFEVRLYRNPLHTHVRGAGGLLGEKPLPVVLAIFRFGTLENTAACDRLVSMRWIV